MKDKNFLKDTNSASMVKPGLGMTCARTIQFCAGNLDAEGGTSAIIDRGQIGS